MKRYLSLLLTLLTIVLGASAAPPKKGVSIPSGCQTCPSSIPQRSEALTRAATSDIFQGELRVPVILVNFTDQTFTTSLSDWDAFFNEEGYNDGKGSVRDYFTEASYGALNLTFDVVGPVTVSHATSYYGSGSSESNTVIMGYEACKLADDQLDFSQYDWDGDGTVDQVLFVFAGYSESQGADETALWSATTWLSNSSSTIGLTLDGTKINTICYFIELIGVGTRYIGSQDGIGTCVHEFLHCLGLPDFYDTSGSNYGMDVWSVLDYGCYNDDGYQPSALTAYERYFLGWLEYKELSAAAHISDMPAITDEPVAYVIYNDNYKKEYYLLQNVQKTGFNSSAYGHGLIIMHVDYSASSWSQNTVNINSSHQRMTIFPANNKFTSYGVNASGAPFPGTSSATSFTDDTSPAQTLYNKNSSGTYYMSKPLTNIDETAGLISFDFLGGSELGTPTALEATYVRNEGKSFQANWTVCAGASAFEVLLQEAGEEEEEAEVRDINDCVLLSEDFSNFYTSKTNQQTDVSESLASYLDGEWTGEALYCSNYYLKIGKTQNSGTTGYISTPLISEPQDTLTLCVAARYSSNASTAGTIYLYNDLVSGSSTIGGSTSEWYYSCYTLPWTYGDFHIKLQGQGLYISGLFAFDGAFSTAELTSYLTSLGAPNATRSIASESAISVQTTGTSHTFSGLTADVYTYKVRAISADGEVGNWSNSITVDFTLGDTDDEETAEEETTEDEADTSGTLTQGDGPQLEDTPAADAAYADNEPDAIATPTDLDALPAYDLSGRPATDASRGIIVVGRNKVLR